MVHRSQCPSPAQDGVHGFAVPVGSTNPDQEVNPVASPAPGPQNIIKMVGKIAKYSGVVGFGGFELLKHAL